MTTSGLYQLAKIFRARYQHVKATFRAPYAPGEANVGQHRTPPLWET